MSNLSAREELREALTAARALYGDVGCWDAEGRLRRAIDAILAEPSPVYSDQLVLVSKEAFEKLRMARVTWLDTRSSDADSSEALELSKAAGSLITSAQSAPISPSHPETLSYDGRCWAIDKRPQPIINCHSKFPLLLLRDDGTRVEVPERPTEYTTGFYNAWILHGGAALYDLITPRVWEFEGRTELLSSGAFTHKVPEGTKVKVVLTEILEEEK